MTLKSEWREAWQESERAYIRVNNMNVVLLKDNNDLKAQLDKQKNRADIYREEVLDSHDVIDRLQEENLKLKAKLTQIKKMLETVLSS